jgi:zinc/manganese transport system permease protein
MSAPIMADLAIRSAAAGALSLALGGAPLGVLLVARRMSLMGDAMSHALLPGVAIAFLVAGPDPWALTLGALIAALAVAAGSTLLSRSGAVPEDAGFAVFYLSALAAGILILGRTAGEQTVHELLFGEPGALDAQGLILAASAATATLVALALFVRGFLAEGADPTFMRAARAPGWALHILLMLLVALNLVAGFKAFGALMTVAMMMIPAASARYWARGYVGQAGSAVLISMAAGGLGLFVSARAGFEPGAVMTLAAAALFAVSAIFGPVRGLIQNLPGRAHLQG